ncbi:MAG: hypothetical protein WC852_02135 [Candidatus Nanoarchaeia archaeon]|jgi:hypothetical protein
MPTLTEYILSGITIISFIIAVWQFFESRYYQKLNSNQTQQITNLINENQTLLQKIDRTSQQTVKHREMNALLPRLFELKQDSFIEQKIKDGINNGFNELKDSITLVSKEMASHPQISKSVKKIDSEIEEARKKTIFNTTEDMTIEQYLTRIKDIDELREYIRFFEWLKEEPREFVKNIGEVGSLLETKTKFITYKFPQVTNVFHLGGGVPTFFHDFQRDLIIITRNKITLSPLGLKLLDYMKNLNISLSQ